MIEQDYILLVDDNPDDAEATQRSLSKNDFGFPVKWLDSGEGVIEHLTRANDAEESQARLPLFVLLDLNMPGLDGKEVLRKIRLNQQFNRVPVIIFTTSNDPRDVSECYNLGANSFIQKPLSYEKLNSTTKAPKNYWLSVALLPGLTG
jgi:CheY-like chemotaxis protein